MTVIRLLGLALDRYLSRYIDRSHTAVSTGKDVLYRTSVGVLGGTVILWIAIFLYASFYYTYMPAVSHVRPVHLQFKSCGKVNGVCSFPTANVTLTRRQQLLMVGQPYKVHLDLEMPESPKNRDLGMFMACLYVLDADGGTLGKSCRSAMLHYKSLLLRTMSTIVFSPFLLWGSSEEKQFVQVELYSGYEEDPIKPATDMRVELQSNFVEVYSAHLRINAHFVGLRYFMFNWPVVSGMVGVGTNLFFLLVVALLSWYHFYPHEQELVERPPPVSPTKEHLNVPSEGKGFRNDEFEVLSKGSSSFERDDSPEELDFPSKFGASVQELDDEKQTLRQRQLASLD